MEAAYRWSARGEFMAKCNNCGEKIREEEEICPKCGINPGPVTITALPKTPIWRRKKKEKKR
jgi:rRNA maturation endonuclease Nob1